jgi:hypothetical protein
VYLDLLTLGRCKAPEAIRRLLDHDPISCGSPGRHDASAASGRFDSARTRSNERRYHMPSRSVAEREAGVGFDDRQRRP